MEGLPGPSLQVPQDEGKERRAKLNRNSLVPIPIYRDSNRLFGGIGQTPTR